jgi:DNA repair protein RecN (Recombination protein N)
MLIELQVKNLATIDNVRLQFKKGFTVLSGDEGAGKSLLVDALCLLAGGRASTSLIRHGTSSTLVEGVFTCSASDSELGGTLKDAGIEVEPDETLILTREVQEQGRGIARIN